MNFRQLFDVMKKPIYLLLALTITIVVFSLAVLLPNISLIYTVATSSSASFLDVIGVIFALLGSIVTNFTVISAIYTVLIAILFGINISLLIYYIKKVQSKTSTVTSTGVISISGLISGFFGIGCAACGTFILTSVLALFGATGILTFLPFGGEEFGFLGVGLLLYSIYSLVKKLEAPLVCEIKN